MEMVYYSWGMPLAMQQIGEETFWNVKSNTITEEMALNGILNAAIEIGKKQISLMQWSRVRFRNSIPIMV